jgi:hypothetical protein
MPSVKITASVGLNGINNEKDALAVKERLVELGFSWLESNGKVDAKIGPETIRTIQLFQGIKNGFDILASPKNDGLIALNGDTHQWLQAVNAPRWMRMPAGAANDGYVNDEVADTSDDHDFGTSWLADTLRATGLAYKSGFLLEHPGASLMHVNDASMPRGGNTPDHAGHETGLVCDIFLPRVDGKSGKIVVGGPQYDRAAMRAMLKFFLAQPLADRALLNDPVLVSEGLCRPATGHDNHAHLEIRPPAKILGG